jgi:hypothetical protein
MQVDAKQAVEPNRWIDAAGGVTIVFGVMTGVLAAGLVVTETIARTAQEALPLAESGVALLTGTGFVLLGWGVLKQISVCAATAGVLAGAILVLELLWRFLGYPGRGSTYLLVMPLLVLAGNGLAWLEMGRRGARGRNSWPEGG